MTLVSELNAVASHAFRSVAIASRAGLVVAAILAPTVASAAPQWCYGTINNLWVDSQGSMFAMPSWRGDYVMFCNVNQSTGSVSPTTCMTWMSLLRSAIQRNAQTLVYFADAPACNAMPTYSASPVPYYVMLQN